jgi:uncharacterized protein (TIRG00374 family)
MAGDLDLRAVAAGFVGALAVLAVVLWVVGIGEILDQLARVDLRFAAVLPLFALGWLFCWGLALRSVLGTLGISLSVTKAFLVFLSATFVNNVTPFGQAGGEPFTALLIARVSESEYETGLAAIASVDAVNFVPSIGLAFVAVTYYAVTVAVTDRLLDVAAVMLTLTVVVAGTAALAWRYRYGLEDRVVRVASPIVRRAGQLAPRVSPPKPKTIRRRIENFFATIERVAADRRSMAITLGFSTAGWLMLVTCLWLSFFALGLRDPNLLAAAMLGVPLGALASVTPLPGGLGGIEAVLVMVLPTITGVGVATVGAVVLVHRVASYWIPMLVGGGATAALSTAQRG